jgi:glycosyltransferase involved in cell wall biosynthesis
MKVVINAYSARLGGGQTYLKNILTHIPIHSDFEILIFAPPSLKLPSHPQIKRIQTVWPTVNPLMRALWERFGLPIFLAREGADILFCPGGVVGVKAPAECKVVTMFRNMIPFDEPLVSSMPWGLQRLRNIILRRIMLRSMVEADLTIFISDYARELINKLVKIPNSVTIRHGIGESFRTSNILIQRPKKVPIGRYLLYVSRFDVYKHHQEVVRAYAALPEIFKKDLTLVFIGETNMPQAESVKNLVKELDLRSNVLILGAIPYSELPAWYKYATAIIFASSCENCPNILLESMASGRPVLSSNVMPMPEFGGRDLVYFSPFDSREITIAISNILTDIPMAEKLAEASLLRSRSYDWKNTAYETWGEIIKLSNNKMDSQQQ